MQMDSLKQYHCKPLRGCSVPRDCHSMAIQTDVTAVFSKYENIPSSQEVGTRIGTEMLSLLFSTDKKHSHRGLCKCTLHAGQKNVSQAMPSSETEQFQDSEVEDS